MADQGMGKICFSAAPPEIYGPDVCAIVALTDYKTSFTEGNSGYSL